MDGALSLWHSGFMKPLEQTKEDIADVLRNHGVVLGYVFGSYAQGKTTPLSDVDVAIVFGKDVPRSEYFKRELAIASNVGRLLSIDRVDVVNVATVADPLIRHRAVFLGIPVLVDSSQHRYQLERDILQEYEDTQYLRENVFRLMRGRLQDGTFGAAGMAYGGR